MADAVVKSAQRQIWEDPNFQDEMIRFLANDREFLRVASRILLPEDFPKVGVDDSFERKVIATISLNFWNHYKEPVGKLLRAEVLEHIRQREQSDDKKFKDEQKGYNPESIKRLLEYVEHCSPSKKRIAGDAILQRVRDYKTHVWMIKASDQLMNYAKSNSLTIERFKTLTTEGLKGVSNDIPAPSDIFSEEELESRISRRALQVKRERFPVLLIDPLDSMIRVIARKHMGLVLAPYKRGKTMLFIFMALAYALQGLNVLFFTLEDPKEDIEDRFDAAIANMPLSRIAEMPDVVRHRFMRFKRLLKARLKVVDGTDGTTTVAAIEATWQQERNEGFTADVIIIDYDDEIRPQKKQPERRFEFAEIYKDLRAVLARTGCIGWTASQTSRASEDLKIISGKHVAEDISKVRKASFVLSLGKGDWGPDSIFLWVAAHRYDRQDVGCHILTNKKNGLFYDRDATVKREKEERAKKAALGVTP